MTELNNLELAAPILEARSYCQDQRFFINTQIVDTPTMLAIVKFIGAIFEAQKNTSHLVRCS